MCVIEQIIDVPANGKVHFDVSLPDYIPGNQMRAILQFKPLEKQNDGQLVMDDELAALVAEAGRRAERERTDTDYRAQVVARFRECQEGGPIFGGIDGLKYQRECRDEWEDSI
jgi:hypothetical protein